MFINIKRGPYMGRIKLIFTALCLGLFVFSFAYSQEDVLRPKGKSKYQDSYEYDQAHQPFILGIEAGLNYNMLSQTQDWYYEHGTIYDGLESASGFSPHLGVLVDYPLNHNMGIQLRLSYDSKYAQVDIDGFDYNYSLVPKDMTGDVDVVANYTTVTPLFRYNFDENLFMTIGPTIHILSSEIETGWDMAVKGDVLDNIPYWDYLGFGPFSAQKLTFNVLDEYKVETRVGLEFGIGYKVPIAKNIYLVPQGRFQYMLSKFEKDSQLLNSTNSTVIEETKDVMMHSIVFALGLWFEF